MKTLELGAMRRQAKQWARDGAYVFIGILFIVIAYQCFLLPNGIVAGGIGGLSTIANHAFGWTPAIVIYGLSIPLLILCRIFLGKGPFYKTVAGTFLNPTLVGILSFLPAFTTDVFLASIFGGGLTGLGVALVFRADASSGGTSVLVKIIGKYTPISYGVASMLVDGSIVLLALFFFNPDIMLYSLLSVLAMAVAIDAAKIAGKRNLQVFIISERCEELSERIILELDRSVTLLDGEGGYSKQARKVLMIVVDSQQYNLLAQTIHQTDPYAFYVVGNAKEVQGRGFTMKKSERGKNPPKWLKRRLEE